MKNQVKLIIVVLFSAIIYFICNANCTVRFSVPTGFYNDDFYLEINAPSSQIYYTLDGSIPTKESMQYIDPILITDASSNDNVYASRRDVSSFFLETLITDYTDEQYLALYQTPDYLVDKGTIIRVVYYDLFGNRSEVYNASYFVGFDEKDGYSNLQTISIVTDPDNLFDADKGIYVLGNIFEEYSTEYIKNAEKEDIIVHRWWDANYRGHGKEWEREANITFFDQDGKDILNKELGIRIQGGVSRGYASKSLNVYAREEYDETEQIEYDLWNEEQQYYADALTLASGGNDIYTLAKDWLVSQSIKNLDVARLQYEPCNLFLNGEYWGVYHIAEKYTDTYFQHYYNVDPSHVIFVKAGKLAIGKEDDINSFQKLKLFVETENLMLDENYDYLWTQLDKSSTIDYFALMLYCGRMGDWNPLGSNSAVWKTDYIGGGKYEDNKWRWTIYDMNSTGIDGYLMKVDSIENTRNISAFFDNLCTNEDFVQLLSHRIREIGQKEFKEEYINELLDQYVDKMEASMALHYKRYFGSDLTLFYENINDIRIFFHDRDQRMEEFIVKNFGE